jgi:hypothetical protein
MMLLTEFGLPERKRKRMRSVEAGAPSTTLLRRVVPLPRCAGADKMVPP